MSGLVKTARCVSSPASPSSRQRVQSHSPGERREAKGHRLSRDTRHWDTGSLCGHSAKQLIAAQPCPSAGERFSGCKQIENLQLRTILERHVTTPSQRGLGTRPELQRKPMSVPKRTFSSLRLRILGGFVGLVMFISGLSKNHRKAQGAETLESRSLAEPWFKTTVCNSILRVLHSTSTRTGQAVRRTVVQVVPHGDQLRSLSPLTPSEGSRKYSTQCRAFLAALPESATVESVFSAAHFDANTSGAHAV